MISRNQLNQALLDPKGLFKFTPLMAHRFQHLLATEDYGQTSSKASTVLFLFVLMCNIDVEQKIENMMAIFGI